MNSLPCWNKSIGLYTSQSSQNYHFLAPHNSALNMTSEIPTPTTPLGSEISYPNTTGDEIEARLMAIKGRVLIVYAKYQKNWVWSDHYMMYDLIDRHIVLSCLTLWNHWRYFSIQQEIFRSCSLHCMCMFYKSRYVSKCIFLEFVFTW